MFLSKTSSRCLQEMSSRHFQDFARRLQDVWEDKNLLRWTCAEDVFKTYLEGVLKTSWRQINFCWDRLGVNVRSTFSHFLNKIGVLTNFAKFIRKYQCKSPFLIKLPPCSLKLYYGESGKSVFLRILGNFKVFLTFKTPPGHFFWNISF